MKFFSLILLSFFSVIANAQNAQDSLRQRIRSYAARNFSEVRTFNFSWQTMPSHSYTIKHGDNTIEKGERHSINTIKFNTTLPVVQTKHFSMFAIGQADFYNYFTTENTNSSLFSQQKGENNQYFKATLNGTYRTSLAGKPLILNGNISVDGHKKGLEQVLGTLAAVSVIKRNRNTSISTGLAFVWPFRNIPVMPVLTYWHQFSPNYSIDISMPRQVYLRYQWKDCNRLSFGTMMQNDQYYFDSQGQTRLFSETSINTELLYEYVAMKHFYFFARGGLSTRVSGGIYKPNRKYLDSGKLSFERKPKPFFNIGFSYNLYK